MNDPMFFEIQADDPQRAMRFYKEVFGWEFTKQESAPIDYWDLKTEGITGGLLPRPVTVPQGPAGTNAYCTSMRVADFDATADFIMKNGGRVALEKFAVPGRCWQGYFLDPEGNTFGIFEPDENAK